MTESEILEKGIAALDAQDTKLYRPGADAPGEDVQVSDMLKKAQTVFNKQHLVPTYTTHTDLVFQTAQKVLPGVLSSPLMTTALINAMSMGERVTVGRIIVQEAWDMSEALVEKYEEKLSQNASKI